MNTQPATYQIETLDRGNWTTDGIGEPNEFATAEDATAMIEQLRRIDHGAPEWRDGQYRVVARPDDHHRQATA